uniref:PH domain-containing protein n=1 Tax=Emiliania huxleyi TaxID=2903 RepID=A0A7S3U473_EMIHU|mmetsp:Transcript_8668/g.25591  ORF Transcript_8668/g.25591 Transcript_8668/m.25591 type:complete len:253 (-) Transcript_8668:195-953(-)
MAMAAKGKAPPAIQVRRSLSRGSTGSQRGISKRTTPTRVGNAQPSEEPSPGQGEPSVNASLKAVAWLVRLRKTPQRQLQHYISQGDNRGKLWRDIERSSVQVKMTRHGINEGRGEKRELQLLPDGLMYEHEGGKKPKSIPYSAIEYVHAVGGAKSRRWRIKMKNGKDLDFTAPSVDCRNAWVWSVRNNVETYARRFCLEEAHGTAAWRDGVHNHGVDDVANQFEATSLASPVNVRPMQKLGKVAEGREEPGF